MPYHARFSLLHWRVNEPAETNLSTTEDKIEGLFLQKQWTKTISV